MAIIQVIYPCAYVAILCREVLLSERLGLEKFCLH